MAFDTLAFARRLTDAGFTEAQAEALAEVTRDLAIDQMITRAFLHVELEWLARRLAFRIAVIAAVCTVALAAILKL
jgi:hypothetical protein